MGIKFYRSSNKGKKFRKRFNYTRTWFSTHKWVAYFAHPTMVPGHPFKGGSMRDSIGQLDHPEAKRFGFEVPGVFLPPRPDAVHDAAAPAPAHNYSNYAELVQAHLGRNNLPASGTCNLFLNSLRKCFTTNAKGDPEDACQHYIQGLKRTC